MLSKALRRVLGRSAAADLQRALSGSYGEGEFIDWTTSPSTNWDWDAAARWQNTLDVAALLTWEVKVGSSASGGRSAYLTVVSGQDEWDTWSIDGDGAPVYAKSNPQSGVFTLAQTYSVIVPPGMWAVAIYDQTGDGAIAGGGGTSQPQIMPLG